MATTQPTEPKPPGPEPLAAAAYAHLQVVDVTALTDDQRIAYSTVLAILAVRGELSTIARDVDQIERSMVDSADVSRVAEALTDLDSGIRRQLDSLDGNLGSVSSSIDELANPQGRQPKPRRW